MNKRIKNWLIIMTIIIVIGVITIILTTNKWYDYLFLLGSISGIISVVYSNEKNINFIWWGTAATIFKLIYPITQIITGSTMINYSPLIGQLIFISIGIFQYFNWKKPNPVKWEVTKKNAIILALSVFLIWWLISGLLQQNVAGSFVDALGASSYDLATIFMSMNVIWTFPLFIISDITWLIFATTDIINSSGIMLSLAIFTELQVIIYIILAIEGWVIWSK